MKPIAKPYMTITCSSRRLKRMRQGRQTASKMRAARAIRSAVVPAAPTTGNNPLAITAPS